jgi:hypothetical protein
MTKIPFKSIIVEVWSFSNDTPYFLSINLAYFNAAILCLPHTSNSVQRLHGISNEILFMLFDSNLTSKTFSMANKVQRGNPYWYVYLGGIYMIRHIDILKRPKTSGGYFSQFILVSVLTAINISVMKTALNMIYRNQA